MGWDCRLVAMEEAGDGGDWYVIGRTTGWEGMGWDGRRRR